jgi:hypothetical protein
MESKMSNQIELFLIDKPELELWRLGDQLKSPCRDTVFEVYWISSGYILASSNAKFMLHGNILDLQAKGYCKVLAQS